MARRATVIIAAAAIAAVVSALAGCAGQRKRAQADLVQLSAWFPGFYDNQAQVSADRKAGRPAHASLVLAVVPVDASLIGEHVYYVQEATAGRPRHVTMQRLVSFVATKGGLVESLWTFTDPKRWLGADKTPELFTGLQPGDLRPLLGCDLQWTREGGRFTASNDPSECRMASPRTGGVEPIDMRIELGPDALAISTHAAGSRAPAGADRYLRFRRSGGPP